VTSTASKRVAHTNLEITTPRRNVINIGKGRACPGATSRRAVKIG
jgi:hypothetical protein